MSQDDEDEIPTVEKLYCCGNSSQKEATYISRLDLGLAVFEFLCVLSFSIVYAGVPSLFTHAEPYLSSYQVFADFQDFIKLDSILQWAILIGWNLLLIAEIGLAILLTCASQQRNFGLVRLWFILMLLNTLGQVGMHAYMATFSKALVFHTVYAIVLFLYKWYTLWIAWVLMRRIKLVEGGYEAPSDDDFQDVQLQPPLQVEDKL